MLFCLAVGNRAEIEFPVRGVAPVRRLLAIEPWHQRPAVKMRLRRSADQVEQGRKDVDGFGETVDRHAGGCCLAARIADDQRNVVAGVEVAALAQHEMVAHHLGMVGSEYDDGVAPGARCLHRLPDAAELCVDLGDHAVIDGADAAEIFLAPIRHLALDAGNEFGPILPAKIVGEIGVAFRLGLPICSAPESGAVGRVVHGVVGLRHDERRVRADEGDMREPRRGLLLLAKPADEFAGQEGGRRLVF